MGSLVVGVSLAKGLAWSWGVPVVGVNHLEAHVFAPACEGSLPGFPFLALLVSGGHTLLAEVRGVEDMQVLGRTLDDALGEAYDKVAKFLGLEYPGGPIIDRLSESGNPAAIRFPRPMAASGDLNFSLSGLKTAVIRHVRAAGAGLPPVEDVVASFQAAALEVVVNKTVTAAIDLGLRDVVLGGGVACNSGLRRMLSAACEREGLRLVFPSPALCTDNAAMVAAMGRRLYDAGRRSGLAQDVFPNLALGEPIPPGT